MDYEFNQQSSYLIILLKILLSIPGALIIFVLLGFGTRYFIALSGYLGLVRQLPMSERTAVTILGEYEAVLNFY